MPDASQSFKAVVKEYMSKGKDGYNVLADCKVLVDSEHAPILPTLVRNAFSELSIVNQLVANRMKKPGVRGSVEMRHSTFREIPAGISSITDMMLQTPITRVFSTQDALPFSDPVDDACATDELAQGFSSLKLTRTTSLDLRVKKTVLAMRRPMTHGINPICENRIVCLNKST